MYIPVLLDLDFLPHFVVVSAAIPRSAVVRLNKKKGRVFMSPTDNRQISKFPVRYKTLGSKTWGMAVSVTM